ncbi:MAG: histidine phosphatase family protein [Marinilabilia sp.]
MKQLILVRHAKTEPLTDANNDYERQLKKRGQKDTRLVSDHLIGKQITPQMIITSPAKRALQTAKIMAGAFNVPESEIKEEPFIYGGFTIDEFIGNIAGIAGESGSVMVVGHNPEIALMAIQLSGEDFFHFPTTATVVINFSVSHWEDIQARQGRIGLFVYPKELKNKK